MSYQVLARKWRPRRFEEVVGQGHVLKALANALDSGRLHHAYLFTGTRGVGKTTLARIFAKALNCEQGVSSRPCGECSACCEVDEGRFVDLIEVDAASRTRVDETRELLDNVQYAPARGRYKVYLIDEVHMFSGHSFNALLKTLEEPPPHVKFLLATTDPKRLPITVLSRCLQFNLKRLGPAQIERHLAELMQKEGVEHDAASLRLVARAADGSLRDALSLLDQAIAHGGGSLREAEVALMLGTIDPAQALVLLERLAAEDGPGLLGAIDAVAEFQPDWEALLGDLIEALQRIAVLQVAGARQGEEEPPELAALAQRMEPEQLQLLYQIALIGRRDLPLAPDPRAGFEMVLLRMLAFQPAGTNGGTAGTAAPHRPAAAAQEAPPATAAPVTAGGSGAAVPDLPGEGDGVGEEAPSATQQPKRPGPDLQALSWEEMVQRLPLKGLARELANHCTFAGREGRRIRLHIAPGSAGLASGSGRQRLQEALSELLGEGVQLSIEPSEAAAGVTPAALRSAEQSRRQRQAEQAIREDPVVRALQERFDARIEPDSIRPID